MLFAEAANISVGWGELAGAAVALGAPIGSGLFGAAKVVVSYLQQKDAAQARAVEEANARTHREIEQARGHERATTAALLDIQRTSIEESAAGRETLSRVERTMEAIADGLRRLTERTDENARLLEGCGHRHPLPTDRKRG